MVGRQHIHGRGGGSQVVVKQLNIILISAVRHAICTRYMAWRGRNVELVQLNPFKRSVCDLTFWWMEVKGCQ
jgi:hypothetical protein